MPIEIPEFDLYKELEVDPGASPETIEAAYRSLARRYHPDAGKYADGARMKRVNQAYDILKDRQLRADYDRDRGIRRPTPRPETTKARSGNGKDGPHRPPAGDPYPKRPTSGSSEFGQGHQAANTRRVKYIAAVVALAGVTAFVMMSRPAGRTDPISAIDPFATFAPLSSPPYVPGTPSGSFAGSTSTPNLATPLETPEPTAALNPSVIGWQDNYVVRDTMTLSVADAEIWPGTNDVRPIVGNTFVTVLVNAATQSDYWCCVTSADFQLLDAAGDRYAPFTDYERWPHLFVNLDPHTELYTEGWVTFEVPATITRPLTLLFSTSSGSIVQFRVRLAGPSASESPTPSSPSQPSVAPPSPAPTPSKMPGLVAFWPLNEGAGAVAHDQESNHDGTVTNPAWINGYIGSGLHLTTGTQLKIPNAPSLEPQTVSVDLWVRSQAPSPFANILAKGFTECVDSAYNVYMGGDGSLVFFVRNGNGALVFASAGTGAWDGTWRHVVGTYDGSWVRLFVDGIMIGSGRSSTPGIKYGLVDSNDMIVGDIGQDCEGDSSFNGDIDSIRIWNRALTAVEVQSAEPR